VRFIIHLSQLVDCEQDLANLVFLCLPSIVLNIDTRITLPWGLEDLPRLAKVLRGSRRMPSRIFFEAAKDYGTTDGTTQVESLAA
jgi:hypothetical protein